MATKSAQLRVLERPDVLDVIFQYAGPKQWLFLGGVSKAWAAMHHDGFETMRSAAQPEPTQSLRRKVTSYKAATASLRRALYACKCDRSLDEGSIGFVSLSEAAASVGTIDVLIWARAVQGDDRWLHPYWYQRLCIAAATGNQLPTLQWLCAAAEGNVLRDTPQIMTDVAAAAAQYADAMMLQWIFDHYSEQWNEDRVLTVCADAARAATTDNLEWLRARYPQYNVVDDEVAFAAIEDGAVSSLQWLTVAGMTYTNAQYTDYAISCSQYGALRYLIEVANCPWQSQYARRRAAASGGRDVLEWLQQADEEVWTAAIQSQLVYEAALTDNLDAAKWLRAQGAEWPSGLIVFHGVEYTQKRPFGLRTMQWALASGCPMGPWYSTYCIIMCSQDSTLQSQAAQDAITWAHAAGCPCDSKLHHFAARLQHGKKAISDVSMPKRRRWHARLFKLCYTRTGAH
jgi:hypothetical protein